MRKLVVTFCFLGLLFAAVPSSGAPLTYGSSGYVDFIARGLGVTQTMTFAVGSGSTAVTFAGQNMIGVFGTAAPYSVGMFAAYCVDIFTGHQDPQVMTVRAASELPDAGNPALAVAGSGSKAAWLVKAFHGAATTNFAAAALQLAVWEVLYETQGTYDLTVGNFRKGAGWSNGAVAIAQTYLSALGQNTAQGYWLDARPGRLPGQGQDYLVPVPEPGSMLLLGSGLFGLAAAARRRRAGK